MNILTLIQKERGRILKVADTYGLKNVRLFGSIPRGEATDKSDVDFLVELSSEANLFDIIAFKQEIEELLGRKVDVVTEPSLSSYIRQEILNEAVNL